ncbi:MAG: indole-3-glycerol phosphate synthase TrpC [Bacteroidota bacterium]
MLDILQKIAAHKVKEVAEREKSVSLTQLSKSSLFSRTPTSLSERIRTSKHSGVIAEFKRRSPSKPNINLTASPATVAEGYQNAGAAGMSVLTDETFFGGSSKDLLAVRETVSLPLLRKDFTISSYQIAEAKAIGADVILLIAAILTHEQTEEFTRVAHDHGLEVLLEIHEENDLAHLKANVDLVGINNRNLRTFKVDIEHSIRLQEKLPKGLPKISESGLSDPKVVQQLQTAGFDGFLIGESFMKHDDPGAACQQFIQTLHANVT